MEPPSTAATLAAPPLASSPWQRLYAGAHRLRAAWYLRHAAALPRPVISIGNVHWGGTGKTPVVAAIARHLRQQSLAVCILSRGYGGQGRGVRIVSRGAGPLLGAAEAGDEPVQLAGELPGVAVVVGPDRHRAGLEALARLRPVPDVFLLDDGFSHLALRRDLDLLVFPASDPFGGGRLWPGGRLREPLAAAARADALLLTQHVAAGPAAASKRGRDGGAGRSGTDGGAGDAPAGGGALAAALRAHGFAGPGFDCPIRAGAPMLQTAEGPVPLAPGSKVVLVSAVARPDAFAATVRKLDFAVMDELRFADHHPYPAASLAHIAARVHASGAAAALVTAKDGVKLMGRLAVPLAELSVEADPQPAFWDWFDRAVATLSQQSPPAGSIPARQNLPTGAGAGPPSQRRPPVGGGA